ncbi:hypothetical protein [Nitrosomonas sp. Nm58]|uniref:hypothetical protein n=1 Tax=Nitrosomonas sp. Nm58 TaxID=200126 RepID=UPI0008980766|nr:hypothetical protein [Nitrosomonas sp. Nm58]SDY64179.1 hypothetical protein SAMN05421754_101623 [Nitrosomonas sp. Nm58]
MRKPNVATQATSLDCFSPLAMTGGLITPSIHNGTPFPSFREGKADVAIQLYFQSIFKIASS